MSRYIVIYASKLAESQAMDVFYCVRFISLLHPHSHANVFHFEHLLKMQFTRFISHKQMQFVENNVRVRESATLPSNRVSQNRIEWILQCRTRLCSLAHLHKVDRLLRAIPEFIK